MEQDHLECLAKRESNVVICFTATGFARKVPVALERTISHGNRIWVSLNCREFDEISNCQLLIRRRVHQTRYFVHKQIYLPFILVL
jgi:hypothetical protein